MLNDLDIIIKDFPEGHAVNEMSELHVYAIGDVHVGSRQYNEKVMLKKLDIIKSDPLGVLVLCGDLADYGLKNSKTNVYEATMQPKEQFEYVRQLFEGVKDRIVSCISGNHERRITREVGMCPTYDLCVLWGCPEVYRENVAIVKYVFGNQGNKHRITFVGITTHGSSRIKHQKFIAGFEGVDFAVSGHTHTPMYCPHGRIRVDRINGKASHVPYKEIVVDANLDVGGYSLTNEYEISSTPELQCLELKTYRDNADNGRKLHRIMDYRTFTIE